MRHWPHISRWLAGLLACVATCLLASCDFQQPVCVSDSECQSGFFCSTSSGYCEPRWDEIGEPGADTSEDTSEADGHREDTMMGDVIEDSDDLGDAGEEDTFFVPSACVGESTDDGCLTAYEPNDTAASAHALTSSAFGCSNDEFRDYDSVKGAGLCGADSTDFYELEYVECRDRAFRIDIIVEPESGTCPHDVYGINARIGPRDFECSPEGETTSRGASCTLMTDGRRQLTLTIDRQSQASTQVLLIEVRSYAEPGSAYFDYDMRVRLL